MKLSATFKHRNFWLGLAMVWIAYIHSGLVVPFRPLREIKELAFIAVDMCVFASGIGCFFSLDKDPHALRFLGRRVKRLGCVHLCFLVPWVLWRMSTGVFPKKAILGNLLGLQSLISWDYHFNWYISGMLLFYFLAPYFKQLTDSIHKLWQDALVVAFLVMVGVPFWQSGENMVIIARFPILYVGMVYAKLAKQGLTLNKKSHFFHGLAMVIGLAVLWLAFRYTPGRLWSHGLYWYPCILIAPGFCVFLSMLSEKIQNAPVLRLLYRGLSILGIYSFEFYLVHIFFFESLVPALAAKLPFDTGNLYWLLSLIPVGICCFLLNRAARLLSKCIDKFSEKIKA